MRFHHRRTRELEEGESYYVSMTDMMVGVLFIFIIMLSFFALNYHAATASLTSAKDSQTTALLQLATALERKDVSLEIDHKNHIVCIPGDVLVDDLGTGNTGRHCFAYSDTAALPMTAAEAAAAKTRQDQAYLVGLIESDLTSDNVPEIGNTQNGSLSFSADQLFIGDTATLSPQGANIAAKVAGSLADRLPCYGFGVAASTSPACANSPKLWVVNVVAQANFDAFTLDGQRAAALSLQRSVSFHDALTKDQPILGQLFNGPAGPGVQPLLRVANFGQSESDTPPAGSGQNISIRFQLAQAQP